MRSTVALSPPWEQNSKDAPKLKRKHEQNEQRLAVARAPQQQSKKQRVSEVKNKQELHQGNQQEVALTKVERRQRQNQQRMSEIKRKQEQHRQDQQDRHRPDQGTSKRTKVQARPTRSRAMEASCLLYTSPSPRDRTRSRMPSSA
eukprot:TRINITY_DN35935_c0_g1_i1.p1 TRINITY_DN35935_c0_g1~~TRINITY_DN35935_c0_g1_i1.p1  ORF type:complete len:145 (-),score=29.57 TRINITY_DN35935_c0_g1_i1:9-443(-)